LVHVKRKENIAVDKGAILATAKQIGSVFFTTEDYFECLHPLQVGERNGSRGGEHEDNLQRNDKNIAFVAQQPVNGTQYVALRTNRIEIVRSRWQ